MACADELERRPADHARKTCTTCFQNTTAGCWSAASRLPGCRATHSDLQLICHWFQSKTENAVPSGISYPICCPDRPEAGRNACTQALDRWEERLEGIFDGRPYDILDAALADTVTKYPVHIQPFRDMIDGMRMDLHKSRCGSNSWRCIGTVGRHEKAPLYHDVTACVWTRSSHSSGRTNRISVFLHAVPP